jgi:RNA polymerase sigma factor (sigma-70 family)
MTAQQTEIEYLIQGCKAGERKAQHELYKYFYEFTMRIAMRYARDEADAADILSHAFVRVFKSIRNYDSSKGNFHGWVKRIVINEGLDHARSRNEIEHIDLEEVAEQSVNNAIIENIDVAEVMLQVKKLPPATHAVFIMYAIDGFAHKEIAEKLGISEGTSKWHLSEARKTLQKSLVLR